MGTKFENKSKLKMRLLPIRTGRVDPKGTSLKNNSEKNMRLLPIRTGRVDLKP